jgi:hypothetical protein
MSLDFYESEMQEYLNSPEWLNRRRLEKPRFPKVGKQMFPGILNPVAMKSICNCSQREAPEENISRLMQEVNNIRAEQLAADTMGLKPQPEKRPAWLDAFFSWIIFGLFLAITGAWGYYLTKFAIYLKGH